MNSRTWRKSSRSSSQAQCVELSVGVEDAYVRDTKARDRGTLTFDGAVFRAFLGQIG